jgi:hypothetical protein
MDPLESPNVESALQPVLVERAANADQQHPWPSIFPKDFPDAIDGSPDRRTRDIMTPKVAVVHAEQLVTALHL